MQALIEAVFALTADIRYVALLREGILTTHQRLDLSNPSCSDSDRYEELLVNPTLLTLARQRGNIDCGGLSFVVVGYESFQQLILPLADGHISVCFEHRSTPQDHVAALSTLIAQYIPTDDIQHAVKPSGTGKTK